LTIAFFSDGVENPANLARIHDVARLLGASCTTSMGGRLIAVENTDNAGAIYGRKPLHGDATIAVGNERRGLSQKTLAAADETVTIPVQSRTVTTLNVAAAAAVAGWYLVRGSGGQASATRPENRRPALLLVGDDHVEVGSSLRSAAAFGFREVLLEDRRAGWFAGPSAVRREARAAARRYKNPLLVRPAMLSWAARYDEVVVVTPSGTETPLQRAHLAHGRRQLIIIGAQPDEVVAKATGRVKIASLALERMESPPLRLVASIALAEIARQVGRRRPFPGPWRGARYEKALELSDAGEALLVDPSDLMDF